MSKYEILLKVLDGLCEEAPKGFTSYHPKMTYLDKVIQARATEFIHLYLKVKFALNDFNERHRLITDGPQDGGLDAY